MYMNIILITNKTIGVRPISHQLARLQMNCDLCQKQICKTCVEVFLVEEDQYYSNLYYNLQSKPHFHM